MWSTRQSCPLKAKLESPRSTKKKLVLLADTDGLGNSGITFEGVTSRRTSNCRTLRLLRTDPVPEEGEDVAATIGANEPLSEEEREELRRELTKVEEEIQTLSQVLAAKEKHLAEIKRKLGINSLQELKQNLAKGWQDVTATSAYKKTSETLSQAGQKASAAFSSVGSVITKKLEDVKNSPTFKSFEEKVENLKSKVGGSKPAGGDFGDVLNSTANASATTTEPLPEQTQESL